MAPTIPNAITRVRRFLRQHEALHGVHEGQASELVACIVHTERAELRASDLRTFVAALSSTHRRIGDIVGAACRAWSGFAAGNAMPEPERREVMNAVTRDLRALNADDLETLALAIGEVRSLAWEIRADKLTEAKEAKRR